MSVTMGQESSFRDYLGSQPNIHVEMSEPMPATSILTDYKYNKTLNSVARHMKCGQCQYTTKYPSDMLRHKRIHTGQKFACGKCTNRYQTRSALQSHINTCHGTPLLCHQCSKAFKSKAGLNEHLLSVHQEKWRYACTFCDRQFTSKPAYIGHENTHRNCKPYTCNKCSKAYSYRTSLVDHEKKCCNADVQRPSLTCTICKKGFNFKDALKEHKKAKHSGKKLSCAYCCSTFDWRQSLSRHIKTCKAKHLRDNEYSYK